MTPMTYNAYATSAISEDIPKDRLLIMLYEGAIKFLHLAERGIQESRHDLKGHYISKVMAIITELTTALDMKQGGEISTNLESLYAYMINRLTHANVSCDVEAIREVERLITELKEGFVEASRSLRKAPAAPRPAESTRVCVAI
ncbi:MAG: flagellar export chaperone FliS [Desulfobacterales bacterium]|nr:flagellar export chaperone FliS [Desulfobacterales bacterium]